MLKKLLLIVNPNAGTRQAHRLLPEMISALTAGGYLVTVCVTDKNGERMPLAGSSGRKLYRPMLSVRIVRVMLSYFELPV